MPEARARPPATASPIAVLVIEWRIIEWDTLVMTLSTLEARPQGSHSLRGLRWVILAAAAAFVTMVAVKAFMQTFDQDDFPEDLLLKVELMPVIFPVHMFTGALALVLIPLALLLRPQSGIHRRKWHRIAGRIAAADVLVAGLTAYPVALVAPVTTGSAAGFSAQATVWLILLVLGIRNIRRDRVERHRACMLLMTATASGAIFFRIYLASWAILAQGKHFAVFYAWNAWLAWLLPLLGTALVLRAGMRRSIAR
jgi:uncharacterized membrane protein YozB (DUF420 family)